MDSRSSDEQLDETACESRMRFVDVVRIAGFGVLGAASPWVAWALLAAILPLLGYRWDFFSRFPAAKISVPTSVICGVLHALAEWRSLQRRSLPIDPAIEAPARQRLDGEPQDTVSAKSEGDLRT